MRAYTHQPFHVRRHSSTTAELNNLKTTSFLDGRATHKVTQGQGRRGSTFPLQGSTSSCHGDVVQYWKEPKNESSRGPKMELVWENNQTGKLPGMIRTPKDLCFFGDRNLAVAEEKNSRLQVLSVRTGKSKGCVDKSSGAPGLVSPSAISLSKDGSHFLVADRNTGHCINLGGEQELVWPGEVRPRDGAGAGPENGRKFQRIAGLAADCFDNFVIADSCAKRGHTLGIYSKDTAQLITQCKLKSGHFGEPSYVACNRRIGITYVADCINGSIYGFDKNGKHVFTFGNNNKTHNGTSSGLICPLGMDISADDNVYVVDKGSQSVTVWPVLGGERPVYEALSSREDGLRDPVAISVGPHGAIAVAEETLDFGHDSFAVKLFNKSD